MAYKPLTYGQVRDKAYPSQIATARPIAAPRIHCEETPDPNDSLRGGVQPMHTEAQYERFHNELRSGHGFVNEDDPDETGRRVSTHRTLFVEGDPEY